MKRHRNEDSDDVHPDGVKHHRTDCPDEPMLVPQEAMIVVHKIPMGPADAITLVTLEYKTQSNIALGNVEPVVSNTTITNAITGTTTIPVMMIPSKKINANAALDKHIPFVRTVLAHEPEIWAGLGPNFPGYLVSSRGQMKMLNGRIGVHTQDPKRYVSIALKHSSKQLVRMALHIMIAKVFIPNPHNKPCVNHINGIRCDNALSNLEWATFSENSKNMVFRRKVDNGRKIGQYKMDGILVREWKSPSEAANTLGKKRHTILSVCNGYNPHAYGFVWKYILDDPVVEGEEWKKIIFNGVLVKVSSHGRVSRAGGTLRTSELIPISTGYLQVGFNNKSELVHRLIAQAFLGPPPPDKPYVNHKNSIRHDNHVENLEWASASENISHAAAAGRMTGHRNCAIGVQQLDRVTKEVIDTFRSISEAELITNSHNITSVCTGKYSQAGGFGWRFTETLPTIVATT